MLSLFSEAYLLGEFYVEPYDGQKAVMHPEDQRVVNSQLVEEDEQTQFRGLYDSIVMKLGATHFRVFGEQCIPSRTIAVPREILGDDSNVSEYGMDQVFVPKPSHTRHLFE